MQKQPPEVFYKKAAFKSFAIFTRKHLCWSLKACTSLLTEIPTGSLPMNIAKFLRTYFEKHMLTSTSVYSEKKNGSYTNVSEFLRNFTLSR